MHGPGTWGPWWCEIRSDTFLGSLVSLQQNICGVQRGLRGPRLRVPAVGPGPMNGFWMQQQEVTQAASWGASSPSPWDRTATGRPLPESHRSSVVSETNVCGDKYFEFFVVGKLFWKALCGINILGLLGYVVSVATAQHLHKWASGSLPGNFLKQMGSQVALRGHGFATFLSVSPSEKMLFLCLFCFQSYL